MKIALLGCGVMGEAVLAGLGEHEVVVAERRAERAGELAERHGVRVVAAPAEAVGDAEAVILAVKPQDALDVCRDIGEHLPEGAVVVSLCAGLSTARLEDVLPTGAPVVRVMPNTPARIGRGVAAASAGSLATEEHLRTVIELLAGTGRVVTVEEKHQDAVTAVSGSGPAYLFLVAEAMNDAAVRLGLPRDLASQLVSQTLLGSAALLAEPDAHPTLLREQVTSPGGTTAAALAELEAHGLRTALAEAMTACRDRSVDLGG